MKASKSIDCSTFREFAYHFQAGEVPEEERHTLQEHLNRCEACASYLAVEDSFLGFLKSRLRGVPAPPGLETRIRAALEREAPAPSRRAWGWLFRPGTAAAAAALTLALLLGPVLRTIPGDYGIRADVVHVVKAVTVVDRQCDEAGRTLEQQRGCRHARHVNALKPVDGSYWNFNLGQDRYREIALDPEWRGRRVKVEGDLYPALSTIHLTHLGEAGRTTL